MTMMFGAIAAVASSSASFPLEIVRRRAMMGTLPAGSGLHPSSDWHAHPGSLHPQSRHLCSWGVAAAQSQLAACLEHAQACGSLEAPVRGKKQAMTHQLGQLQCS